MSPYELLVPSKLDPVMHYSLAIQLLFISPTSNVTEAFLIMYVCSPWKVFKTLSQNLNYFRSFQKLLRIAIPRFELLPGLTFNNLLI